MTTIPFLITAAVEAIRAEADALTALDQAIGDGDHGINMKRGFEAIGETADQLAPLAWGQALQKAGMTLVMKVGGASGPLYGSLLMSMGKSLGDDADPAVTTFIAALADGIEAVKKRGKSDVGAKTMLDVLVPLHAALAATDSADRAALVAVLRETSTAALEGTRDMVATKGRASFLGERSRGHLDPGARSSTILAHVVAAALGEAANA